MSDAIDPTTVHRLKNQLAIVIGFCELILTEMPPDHPLRPDVLEIQKAGRAAVQILRETSGM